MFIKHNEQLWILQHRKICSLISCSIFQCLITNVKQKEQRYEALKRIDLQINKEVNLPFYGTIREKKQQQQQQPAISFCTLYTRN